MSKCLSVSVKQRYTRLLVLFYLYIKEILKTFTKKCGVKKTLKFTKPFFDGKWKENNKYNGSVIFLKMWKKRSKKRQCYDVNNYYTS